MPRAPRFGANPTHYVQLSGLVKAQDWRKISSVLQVASDFRGPVWREVDAALSGQVQVAEEQRLAMAQYTASVAIHDDLRLVALTAPRGNRFFIWDLDSGAVRLDTPLPDCAGVGAVKNGFVVTSGQGRCRFYDCQGARMSWASCCWWVPMASSNGQ